MHDGTFSIKRLHLTAVAFGKDVVKHVPDMTPARFDLMYAIRINHLSVKETEEESGKDRAQKQRTLDELDEAKRCLGGFCMRQDMLRVAVGLHVSTVSEAVQRLVDLGWIEVLGRHPVHWRTKVLKLTELGVRRIEHAMHLVFVEGSHDETTWTVAEACDLRRDPEELRADLFAKARYFARSLGDLAMLEYPSRPLRIGAAREEEAWTRRWRRLDGEKNVARAARWQEAWRHRPPPRGAHTA